MRYLIITAFFCSCFCRMMAQDVTGLWKGTLYNDSTQLYYQYEIAISEEKGKLYGFSHTWFLLNDKQYYGVKKVRITKKGNTFYIEDNGLIANNYPVAPAKNVRQLNELTLDMQDSMMILKGPFTTNRTTRYAPLTGRVVLKRKNDYWQSALIPHLKELKKEKELLFVKDVPEKEIVIALNRNEQLPVIEKKERIEKSGIVKKDKKVVVAGGLSAEIKPAAELSERKTIVQETVYFTQDSLQIYLYDNGEVDGDTVSVVMNGEVILAKQRLSTNAITKTIFIEPGLSEIQLVMYAENLGTIPPNTGLMVVKDGKDMYEIRFSGDLQKNAAIIFKRKK